MGLRISTTVLESFRLWSDPDQEWMSEEDLHQTIKGVFSPTPQMLLGQAFGKCIANPDKYRKLDGYEVFARDPVAGWVPFFFKTEVVSACLEKFDRRGVFEVRGSKQYGEHTVIAKADQILGVQIKENKVKVSSQFDFDKYANSCQWRFYLDIFEGAQFLTYTVFLLEDGPEIGLRSIEEFNLYPYPYLQADCAELVREFVEYVKTRELEGFLQPKVTGVDFAAVGKQ